MPSLQESQVEKKFSTLDVGEDKPKKCMWSEEVENE